MAETTAELVDRMERYCSERERGIDAGMELGMASIDGRAKIWVEELRSLVDAAKEAQKIAVDKARLELELAASQRESDRWRHGVPVEGDFVCPDSLRADALSERLHEAEAIVDYLSDAAVDALSGELSVMRAAYREKWGSK